MDNDISIFSTDLNEARRALSTQGGFFPTRPKLPKLKKYYCGFGEVLIQPVVPEIFRKKFPKLFEIMQKEEFVISSWRALYQPGFFERFSRMHHDNMSALYRYIDIYGCVFVLTYMKQKQIRTFVTLATNTTRGRNHDFILCTSGGATESHREVSDCSLESADAFP